MKKNSTFSFFPFTLREETFAEENFANFGQNRESLFVRKILKEAIRESLFPQNLHHTFSLSLLDANFCTTVICGAQHNCHQQLYKWWWYIDITVVENFKWHSVFIIAAQQINRSTVITNGRKLYMGNSTVTELQIRGKFGVIMS